MIFDEARYSELHECMIGEWELKFIKTTNTYIMTIYRVVEIRGTAQRQTFEVINVDSFPETAYKGFIDPLLLYLCSWPTKSLIRRGLRPRTRKELPQ